MSQRSHFELFAIRAPRDVRTLLARKHLSAEDVINLSKTSRTLKSLFDSSTTWSALMRRDYHIGYVDGDNAKQHYAEIIAERKRLIAYVQIFLNPLYATQDPNSIDATHTDLRDILILCEYNKFIEGCKWLIRKADQKNVNDHADTLKGLYEDIFISPCDISTSRVTDVLDNRDINVVNLVYSSAKKLNLMMSLLVKVGAYRSLELLFYKLNQHQAAPDEQPLKARFLSHFGSTMLCDAVTYHRPEITALLLNEGVNPNEKAALNEFSENPHLLPLECAIKALHFYYRSHVKQQALFSNDGALSRIGECIKLLFEANADVDLNVVSMSPRGHHVRKNLFAKTANQAPVQSMSVRDYAADVVRQVNEDQTLGQQAQVVLCQILEPIIYHNLEVKPVPMEVEAVEQQPDTSHEDFSSDTEAKEPSPKKARSAENTPTKKTGLSRLSLGSPS